MTKKIAVIALKGRVGLSLGFTWDGDIAHSSLLLSQVPILASGEDSMLKTGCSQSYLCQGSQP
jgi:hypothetical protein